MNTNLSSWIDFLLSQSLHLTILFVVIGLLAMLARKRSAHLRYLLWLVVLVKCLVPPLLTIPMAVLPQASEPPQVASEPLVANEMPSDVAEATTPISAFPVPTPSSVPRVAQPMVPDEVIETSPPETRPVSALVTVPWYQRIDSEQGFLLVWLTGTTILLLITLYRVGRFNYWIRRARQPLDESLLHDVEVLGDCFVPPMRPRVYTLEGISQPFVWGLWRGCIYVPANFEQTSSVNKRASVLLHEMAHVRRLDPLVNLIQILVQMVYWFHPLIWIANRFIRAEREKCCDEIAIAKLKTSPKDYGSAIVETLVQEYQSRHAVPTLAVAGPVKNLEDRIKTIMKPGKQFYTRPTFKALLATLLLFIIVVPTTIALTQRETSSYLEIKPFNEKPKLNVIGVHPFGRPEGIQWFTPDGRPLNNRTEMERLKAGLPSAATPCFGLPLEECIREVFHLQLCFTYPSFDRYSGVFPVRMWDEEDRPHRIGMRVYPGGYSMSFVSDFHRENYLVNTVGIYRDYIPKTCSTELYYACGLWTEIMRIIVDSDDVITLEGNAKLLPPGERSYSRRDFRGPKAYVPITNINQVEFESKQYGFVAILQDGRSIPVHQIDEHKNMEIDQRIQLDYVFDCPLADIEEFVLQSRPVQRVALEDIPLSTILSQPEVTRAMNVPILWVLDRKTGNPISDCSFTFSGWGQVKKTNERGYYTADDYEFFRRLKDQRELTLWHPGYENQQIEMVENDEDRVFTVMMDKAGGSSLQVKFNLIVQGEPKDQLARVCLLRGQQGRVEVRRTKSDGSGDCQFGGLAVGDYRIELYFYDAYPTHYETVHLDPHEHKTIDIDVRTEQLARIRVSGKLLNKRTGQGIGGATLHFVGAPTNDATTYPDGSFSTVADRTRFHQILFGLNESERRLRSDSPLRIQMDNHIDPNLAQNLQIHIDPDHWNSKPILRDEDGDGVFCDTVHCMICNPDIAENSENRQMASQPSVATQWTSLFLPDIDRHEAPAILALDTGDLIRICDDSDRAAHNRWVKQMLKTPNRSYLLYEHTPDQTSLMLVSDLKFFGIASPAMRSPEPVMQILSDSLPQQFTMKTPDDRIYEMIVERTDAKGCDLQFRLVTDSDRDQGVTAVVSESNPRQQLYSLFMACGMLCTSIQEAVKADDFETALDLCRQVDQHIEEGLVVADQVVEGPMFKALAAQFNFWKQAIEKRDKMLALKLGDMLNQMGGNVAPQVEKMVGGSENPTQVSNSEPDVSLSDGDQKELERLMQVAYSVFIKHEWQKAEEIIAFESPQQKQRYLQLAELQAQRMKDLVVTNDGPVHFIQMDTIEHGLVMVSALFFDRGYYVPISLVWKQTKQGWMQVVDGIEEAMEIMEIVLELTPSKELNRTINEQHLAKWQRAKGQVLQRLYDMDRIKLQHQYQMVQYVRDHDLKAMGGVEAGVDAIEFQYALDDLMAKNPEEYRADMIRCCQIRLGSPQDYGKLEFRIVPASMESSRVVSMLSVDQERSYRESLKQEGPEAYSRQQSDYLWLPLGPLTNVYDFVVEEFEGEKYILVCNRHEQMMLADGSWSLSKVDFYRDAMERLVVDLELDEAGGEKMRMLSRRHLKQHMAVIMDGEVLSVPRINEVMGKQMTIGGNFTESQVREIVLALHKRIGRSSEKIQSEPTQPADANSLQIKIHASLILLPSHDAVKDVLKQADIHLSKLSDVAGVAMESLPIVAYPAAVEVERLMQLIKAHPEMRRLDIPSVVVQEGHWAELVLGQNIVSGTPAPGQESFSGVKIRVLPKMIPSCGFDLELETKISSLKETVLGQDGQLLPIMSSTSKICSQIVVEEQSSFLYTGLRVTYRSFGLSSTGADESATLLLIITPEILGETKAGSHSTSVNDPNFPQVEVNADVVLFPDQDAIKNVLTDLDLPLPQTASWDNRLMHWDSMKAKDFLTIPREDAERMMQGLREAYGAFGSGFNPCINQEFIHNQMQELNPDPYSPIAKNLILTITKTHDVIKRTRILYSRLPRHE